MTLLGLDFDNTLVHYDNLFHKLALEKNLIEESVPAQKTAIRDYLRSRGQDVYFTLLQGEVYGLRILEAEPAEGMISTLKALQENGISMHLISHKTKTPYKGPAYDLQAAARAWLEKYGFFSTEGLSWTQEQVYFEESKESKLLRIKSLNCTHYIDDLPEILDMLPPQMNRILYAPNDPTTSLKHTHMRNWEELPKIIKG